jgi:hypothetical protein
LSPVFACASLLALLFAPDQRNRRAFLAASLLEAVAFGIAAVVLLFQH